MKAQPCEPCPTDVSLAQWKVSLGGRVEKVTDQPGYLALFEGMLTSDPGVIAVRWQIHDFPHANRAEIVLLASSKSDVETKGREIMKRILRQAASDLGIGRYGWTVSSSAELVAAARDVPRSSE